MLVNALVISQLDCCNCLLYGIPEYQRDKLQRIQNTAARFVMGLKRSDHVTPVLKNLHWLPVEKRQILLITYSPRSKRFRAPKPNGNACYAGDTTYKTIHGQSADYLTPSIEMCQPSRNLRSASRSLLCPQKTKTENYGCRERFFFCGTDIVEFPTGGH